MTLELDPLKLNYFGCGVVGSIGAEVVKIIKVFESGKPFPARHRRFSFWFFRTLLALFGGVAAFAANPNNELTAIGIGAAAPALLENLARRESDP